MEVTTKTPKGTFALGKKLAAKLHAGDAVLLYGDLGAGKTELVKGICSGLGYKGRVLSPTFQIVREYKIECKKQNAKCKIVWTRKIFHIDLYRLESGSGLEGIEEYFGDKEAVTLVEWAERLSERQLPQKYLKVSIEILSESERRFGILEVVPTNGGL